VILLLQNCPKLSKVPGGQQNEGSAVSQVICALPNLKILRCDVDPLTLNAVEKCPALKELTLRFVDQNPDYDVTSIFARCENLSELTLSDWEATMPVFWGNIRVLTKLKKINFSSCKLTHYAVHLLTGAFEELPLVEINMDCSDNLNGLWLIHDIGQVVPTLTALTLFARQVQYSAPDLEFPNLISMAIESVEVPTAVVQRLPCTSLNSLSLHNVNLSDEACATLALRCPHLTMLEVDRNPRVTDIGVGHLTSLPLRNLTITRTGITSAVWRVFQNAVPTLEFLVCGCDNCIVQLALIRPTLNVI